MPIDFVLSASYKGTVTNSAKTLLTLTGLAAIPAGVVGLAIVPEDLTKPIRYTHGTAPHATTSPAWPVDGVTIVPVWPASAAAMKFLAGGLETSLPCTVMLFARR